MSELLVLDSHADRGRRHLKVRSEGFEGHPLWMIATTDDGNSIGVVFDEEQAGELIQAILQRCPNALRKEPTFDAAMRSAFA